MEEPNSDNWPDYLPGPRDDLLALGVISLNYGFLENIFAAIFSMVTGMTEVQVAAVFLRINNRTREDVFDQMLDTQKYPPQLLDLISHFMKGFRICVENRNDIMHSHHGGVHSGARGTAGIVLTKYSRAGKRLTVFAHAGLLRTVADDIDRQATFGGEVVSEISAYELCRQQDRLADFGKIPLRGKPPLPSALSWLSHPDIRADPRQPEPSQG